MNKEEKEAIEYIKAFQKDLYGASEKNLMAIYIDRVWNYIDKLQKELEQEKKKHKSTTYNFELVVDKLDNSISKDKIRDKIKELENIEQEDVDYSRIKFATIVLEELLKEEEL